MKRCYYSIADANNLKYFEYLKNSFKKFHPDDELILFGDEQIKASNDSNFLYRATPAIAKTLFEQGYTQVCKIDADTIITGNLDYIWEGNFDVAVVNNSNPKEDKSYPIRLWNIHPYSYVNCGLVVLKSKFFIEHWLALCYSDHFNFYHFKEQDLLNIMVFYMSKLFGGPYEVKFLDASNKWHGLISKGYWSQIELSGNSLILRKNEEWPVDHDKEIVAMHWAGGNNPKKMEDINIRFKEDVAKYLHKLIK